MEELGKQSLNLDGSLLNGGRNPVPSARPCNRPPPYETQPRKADAPAGAAAPIRADPRIDPMSATAAPSLTEHVAAIAAGAHVAAAHWLADRVALALADGVVLLAGDGGETRSRRIPAAASWSRPATARGW